MLYDEESIAETYWRGRQRAKAKGETSSNKYHAPIHAEWGFEPGPHPIQKRENKLGSFFVYDAKKVDRFFAFETNVFGGFIWLTLL